MVCSLMWVQPRLFFQWQIKGFLSLSVLLFRNSLDCEMEHLESPCHVSATFHFKPCLITKGKWYLQMFSAAEIYLWRLKGEFKAKELTFSLIPVHLLNIHITRPIPEKIKHGFLKLLLSGQTLNTNRNRNSLTRALTAAWNCAWI